MGKLTIHGPAIVPDQLIRDINSDVENRTLSFTVDKRNVEGGFDAAFSITVHGCTDGDVLPQELADIVQLCDDLTQQISTKPKPWLTGS